MGTTRHSSSRLGLILFAALVTPAPHLPAQFGPVLDPGDAPQAKTQQEFHAYLEVVSAKNDHQRIAKGRQFATEYPESALLGPAIVYEMEAHKALNDLARVLESGQQALKLLPDNLRALLTLASAIPNATNDETLLARAEAYATRALDVMEQKQIPKSIPLVNWQKLRAEMASEAHEALGHIAAKRDQIHLAVNELEKAVQLNPSAEGRQFFRLGVFYASLGRNADAKTALARANELGPDLIRQRVSQELQRLEEAASTVRRP